MKNRAMLLLLGAFCGLSGMERTSTWTEGVTPWKNRMDERIREQASRGSCELLSVCGICKKSDPKVDALFLCAETLTAHEDCLLLIQEPVFCLSMVLSQYTKNYAEFCCKHQTTMDIVHALCAQKNKKSIQEYYKAFGVEGVNKLFLEACKTVCPVPKPSTE